VLRLVTIDLAVSFEALERYETEMLGLIPKPASEWNCALGTLLPRATTRRQSPPFADGSPVPAARPRLGSRIISNEACRLSP
jgi:hypothetical protein